MTCKKIKFSLSLPSNRVSCNKNLPTFYCRRFYALLYKHGNETARHIKRITNKLITSFDVKWKSIKEMAFIIIYSSRFR